MWDFQARTQGRNEESARNIWKMDPRKSDLFCLQMAMCGELALNPGEATGRCGQWDRVVVAGSCSGDVDGVEDDVLRCGCGSPQE